MLEPTATQPPVPAPANLTIQPRRPTHQGGFHELLSELNPLQYIPVVGTIYRAVTGDTIPENARLAGSLVVSGLTGGPIGAAINLATLAVEKTLGIDPEKIGATVLADIGIGRKAAPPEASPPPALAAAQTPSWPAALQAAGVTTTADGTLHRGSIVGCDVLNDIELTRIKEA